MTGADRLRSSFRDPSGFVFTRDGVLLRQVDPPYQATWELLKASGLLTFLVNKGILIAFEETSLDAGHSASAVAVIRPERVTTVSYPYEWSFSQFKDAALLTLDVQKHAIEHGLSLKDASAYNVQFHRGAPVFIDTLSFDPYIEGKPWIAYKQFCSHFLAPLTLISLVDSRFGGMMRRYIDGIPLDLASNLLPGSTKFKPGILTHIHLHAKAQSNAGDAKPKVEPKISKTAMLALIDSLRSTVSGLNWTPQGTVWGDYYDNTNYSDSSMVAKHDLVKRMLAKIEPKPETCWDLGANTGEFSRLAAGMGIETVAWDIDQAAVEKAYLWVKESKATHLLPLIQDFSNPSPSIGWGQSERDGLMERGPADVLLVLALVHHLAIANNVPLSWIADFLSSLGRWVIVEFVPKEDSQVQRMLSSREDVFPNYTQKGFEDAISGFFEQVAKEGIPGTSRTLYLLRRLPQ